MNYAVHFIPGGEFNLCHLGVPDLLDEINCLHRKLDAKFSSLLMA